MTDTTYDEARRCYKCEVPAALVKEEYIRKLGIPRGTKLHTFMCFNERCKLFNEVCRVVQVNPDGSIPDPRPHVKNFPKMPDRTEAVRAAVDRQIERETQNK